MSSFEIPDENGWWDLPYSSQTPVVPPTTYTNGSTVEITWNLPEDPEGPSGGVREPRRPLNPLQGGGMALPVPQHP